MSPNILSVRCLIHDILTLVQHYLEQRRKKIKTTEEGRHRRQSLCQSISLRFLHFASNISKFCPVFSSCGKLINICSWIRFDLRIPDAYKCSSVKLRLDLITSTGINSAAITRSILIILISASFQSPCSDLLLQISSTHLRQQFDLDLWSLNWTRHAAMKLEKAPMDRHF